ncbi:MAG: DUF1109 domain-containing protein [Sphingomonadales bacterium]|nr:MAG: DUF1109 domain-containing protein [Sphingomonadales bacterium]
MERNSDALIAELVESLQPVRPLRFGEGLAIVLAVATVSTGLVIGLFGMRADLAAGAFHPMHLLATGLYLGLALAATVAVVVMSRPHVGSDHSGWRWAAGMAGLLPVAGVIVAAGRGDDIFAAETMLHGPQCLAIGGAASLLVFAVLALWLRRGAPTAPGRAGLAAGVAAGAFGIFAFSLHCPDNDIVHLGIWHGAVVLVMAGLGRAVLPSLIRW